MVYQGPDYEDPNPPEEEVAPTKNKKAPKGEPEPPQIRMITPDPVPLDIESGREFAIELGQFIQRPIPEKAEEVQSLKDQGQEVPEELLEKKWVRFFTDQRMRPKAVTSQVISSVESLQNISASGHEENKSPKMSAHGMATNPSEVNYPAPTDDMIMRVHSDSGTVTV